MIKTTDKKPAAISPGQLCYEESTEPSLGIVFCRKDGIQRFACYSFLSTVDFDGTRELKFRFTSWIAIVRGERLQALWKAAQVGCLSQVRQRDHTPGLEPWVREVTFLETESDAESTFTVPPFPGTADPLPKS